MIMQRQVLQSCFDSGVVPLLQFIVRVDGVRTETGTHSAFLGVVVLGTERGCSMEACERISHIFYVLALFAWNLDVISSSPLFWQPLAPLRSDCPRKLLEEFRIFST